MSRGSSQLESRLREEIVEICRRVHEHGWIAATDGNVSVKLPGNRLLCTPSGVHKGYIGPKDLIITDMKGCKVKGEGEPTGEMAMHLACYAERPDIGAVVHTHPPFTVAFSIAGSDHLTKPIIPEVVTNLGGIPTTRYATPTTDEVPASIREIIKDHDSLILNRHGSLCVGATLKEAYYTLEKTEHAAETTYYAATLGKVQTLSPDQVQALLNLAYQAGDTVCKPCRVC